MNVNHQQYFLFKKKIMGTMAILLIVFFVACNSHPTVLMATPEPLPEFILDAQPAPVSKISLQWYKADMMSEIGIDNYEGSRPVRRVGHQSNICLLLDVVPLIQSGDQLITYADVIERSFLFIDNVLAIPELDKYWAHPEIIYVFPKLGADTMAGAPFWLCWPSELQVGVHQIQFVFLQTDGVEKTYSWLFEITTHE